MNPGPSHIRPVSFTLTNLLKYASIMSPLLITFCIIMISIFNNNIVKGLIFITGILFLTFLNYILKNILKEKQSYLASFYCNLLPSPFTAGNSATDIYSSPGYSSTIIGYASSYLIFPMISNNMKLAN